MYGMERENKSSIREIKRERENEYYTSNEILYEELRRLVIILDERGNFMRGVEATCDH